MIRSGWTWVACCILALGCSAKETPPAASSSNAGNSSDSAVPEVPVQPDGGEWKAFESPEGRFSVLMPGEPNRLPSEQGEVSYGVELETGGGFTVMYSDLTPTKPEEIAPKLEKARQDVVGKQKVLHDDTQAKAGDHPARDFAFVDDEGLAHYWRLTIVGDRLYQVMVVTDQKNFEAAKADRERFLTSFKVVEK